MRATLSTTTSLRTGLPREGGVVAPLPDDVSRLLVCSDSVTWEGLHGMPPGTRGAYPPLCDGSFVFPEARSSVVPGSLVKHVANDVVKDPCSTDVFACVHFGFSMFAISVTAGPAVGSLQDALR